MIIIHIMLEFYCLVFFGCSVAIFKRGVVSVSQFFKGSDGRYWLTILSLVSFLKGVMVAIG